MGAEDVAQILNDRIRGMVDDIGDEMAEKLARIFANMPVRGRVKHGGAGGSPAFAVASFLPFKIPFSRRTTMHNILHRGLETVVAQGLRAQAYTPFHALPIIQIPPSAPR